MTRRPIPLLACGSLIALLGVAVQTRAATLLVDRLDDDPEATVCGFVNLDDCSLRGAVIHANGSPEADTIHVPAGTYFLTEPGTNDEEALTGDLDITNSLEIIGEGALFTVVNGNGLDRVFHVQSTGDVTIRDLTVKGGYVVGNGGGIAVTSVGAFSLIGCNVILNESTVISGYNGGGGIAEFYSGGSVLIEDSSISGNTAQLGGGIMALWAEVTIRRSTLSGNTATFHGSATYTGSNVSLVNSTVSGNIEGPSPTGALLAVDGSMTVTSSTIVAGSTSFAVASVSSAATYLGGSVLVGACATSLPDFGGPGTFTTEGGNLESPGNTCNLGFLELRNIPDPMLSPLLPHGGATMTHLPLEGSPAIDHPIATADCPGEDQRGVGRPRDGDGDLDPVCDIGAVEVIWEAEDYIFTDGFESGDTSRWSGESS